MHVDWSNVIDLLLKILIFNIKLKSENKKYIYKTKILLPLFPFMSFHSFEWTCVFSGKGKRRRSDDGDAEQSAAKKAKTDNSEVFQSK